MPSWATSANAANIVNRGITRSIFRWIHIVFSIPILGYIDSPFEKIPNYAPATRFVFVPVMVLSGLWMWKGHVIRRAYFEEIGGWHRFVLEPVIFDRRMTTFGKAVCVTYPPVDADLEFAVAMHSRLFEPGQGRSK